jgi:hypothetical protein
MVPRASSAVDQRDACQARRAPRRRGTGWRELTSARCAPKCIERGAPTSLWLVRVLRSAIDITALHAGSCSDAAVLRREGGVRARTPLMRKEALATQPAR